MDGNTFGLIGCSIFLFILGGYVRYLATQNGELWKAIAAQGKENTQIRIDLARVERDANNTAKSLDEIKTDIKEIRRMLENR